MDALHISENSSGNDCKDVTVVTVYTYCIHEGCWVWVQKIIR